MTLAQELNRTKNKIGLVSGRLTINEYDEMDGNVSAHINLRDWSTEINLRRGFQPVRDRRQRAYARKKKIENGLETLLRSISLHEYAHWALPNSSETGCPYDIYNHDLILEAVKEALPEDKKAYASYVTNAFEDVIINPRVREFEQQEFQTKFEGQVLFWDDQGFQCREKDQATYTPFYEAFVKLNMHLWGDNTDRALLKRHYSNDKKVDEAVKKTIEALNLLKNIQDTSVLFVKENWPSMASEFARSLADLLDQAPTEKLSAFSTDSNDPEQQPGNGIEKKLATKEGKEEVAHGRYSNNKSQSSNITSYEQLDSLYRRLARSIPVEVQAITREQNLAIAPLNFRAFDPERDDIKKLKPTKLFIDEEGLKFGYPKNHVTVTERSKVQRRSFPDFKMIVLDSSDTMRRGVDGNRGNTSFIPWGDNSRYHFALLGFYGIEQFLQAQGIAQYIDHGLALFSSSTRYKESDFRNIQELRKLALSPEFGSTEIDAKSLLNALRGRESFVLSISDGGIHNWAEVKEEFLELAGNNYFAHIQIGPEQTFTQDLEENGFPVFYVNSGEELSRLMVNTALNTYRRFTQQ